MVAIKSQTAFKTTGQSPQVGKGVLGYIYSLGKPHAIENQG